MQQISLDRDTEFDIVFMNHPTQTGQSLEGGFSMYINIQSTHGNLTYKTKYDSFIENDYGYEL